MEVTELPIVTEVSL
jgi:hypothetical protein